MKTENENITADGTVDDGAASLEAASDHTANDGGLNGNIPYTVRFSRTYTFDGSEISEIDLSGLEDLTTADAEYIERVMSKMNYHPRDKFRDVTYTKHIAMKVTNLPIEFFNSLKWKDMQSVTSRIALHFLF